MTTPQERVCAVIVTLDASPDVMADLEAHARFGLGRFPEFDGFVSGALHKNAEGTRLVQYLCWLTEAAYRACIDDPRWNDLPSTKRFMEVVGSGRARMDVSVYRLVARADPNRGHGRTPPFLEDV